jgi:predicted transcriptional regulator
VLGTNIRAEIIHHLAIQAGIPIKALAKSIGYAYSAVHKEVENMARNGLITEKAGYGRMLYLSDGIKRLTRVLTAA